MKDFRKALDAIAYLLLSPHVRDRISGAGMAFDPVPRRRHKTFARSDLKAFTEDYEALLLDGYEATIKAAHTIERYSS